MTTKIDLAEKSKVLDFKRSIVETLNNFKDERVLLEKNEHLQKLIESTESDYDDDSEVIDFEEIDQDLEADILKEFGDELGA